jgi:colicin import membrane protein
MKRGQASLITGFSLRRLWRGTAMLSAAAFAVFADPAALMAAVDPTDGRVVNRPRELGLMAQPTPPPSDAVVPPVRREAPAAPSTATKKPDAPAAQPAANPTPAADNGILGTIQDWLARANREYQGVVVKELSLPNTTTPGGAQGDDLIAKKLKEQQSEEAQKAAAAKRAEEAKRQADADKAAAAVKALEARKLDEDRKRAEETKRLADEAKRKADELLKAEQPAPKPDVPTATADKARLDAETAAAQKREADKLAEEARRQDAQRKADAERAAAAEKKAAEARRAEEQRVTEERRRAAEIPQHRSRTIVITPEPIARPVDPGTTFRPEMARTKAARAAIDEGDAATRREQRRIRVYHEATYRGVAAVGPHRGTAVKRWVLRSGPGKCRAAGRSVSPPARYTVRRGDSLWRISQRHYHEGRHYPKIYRANRAAIADPDLIYPCQRVFVPRKR